MYAQGGPLFPFFVIPGAFMHLVKLGNLCSFHKIEQGRVDILLTGLALNREQRQSFFQDNKIDFTHE